MTCFSVKIRDAESGWLKANSSSSIPAADPQASGIESNHWIEKVEVDANSQKVVVTGYAHRNKILKAIRRGGLKADFWSAQNELLHAYASASYGSLRFSNFNNFF
ncbi:hypothetical protein FEM48_Zijuj06G0003900 [Ziziphus jujuba var. spinosa]|uniref:Uncharacterized protein n=1 Tax=Ziziphus jujuba var. spinosa TaxID=714518 RepID=A0A978V638_ZIZJJ|nr:hypothetical protein FEM48_Zijuj06G0003900 [Ziziphus jujuba var. spinosa]